MGFTKNTKNGLLRSAAHLNQPPGFRRGSDAAPVVDRVAVEAAQALYSSRTDRAAHYASRGVQAITLR